MNERIKLLALEAGLEMCSCGCDMPTRQSAKFAELIVGECADRIRFCIKNDIDFIAEDIEKHFGVEE